jgi:sugar/nucleoside kinase (ribokinase family)
MEDVFASARAAAGERLRLVVVTRGAAGADGYTDGGHIHVPARAAHQVDATGAGDAFAAGLVSAMLAGGTVREALEAGTDAGAAAVEILRSVPLSWIDGARMA